MFVLPLLAQESAEERGISVEENGPVSRSIGWEEGFVVFVSSCFYR